MATIATIFWKVAAAVRALKVREGDTPRPEERRQEAGATKPESDRPVVRTTRMGSQFVKPNEIVTTKVGQQAIQELINAGLLDQVEQEEKDSQSK